MNLHDQVQKKWAEDPVAVKRASLRAKQAAPGISKAQAGAIARSFLKSEILGEIIQDAVAEARAEAIATQTQT